MDSFWDLYLNTSGGTEEVNFYLCRACRAHIALYVKTLQYTFHGPDLNGKHFEEVRNVHRLGPEHNRTVGDFVVTAIYCNGCNNQLGTGFIEVAPHHRYFKAGHVLLHMPKLVLWNGNDIVDPPAG